MVIINSLYFTQNPYSNIFLNHITNGGSGLDRDIISDVITGNKSIVGPAPPPQKQRWLEEYPWVSKNNDSSKTWNAKMKEKFKCLTSILHTYIYKPQWQCHIKSRNTLYYPLSVIFDFIKLKFQRMKQLICSQENRTKSYEPLTTGNNWTLPTS